MKGQYEAGIIAAGWQIVAIAFLTVAFEQLTGQLLDTHVLAWVYLVAALMVGCISRAGVSRSAARMAMAAEQLLPSRRARVLVLVEIRLKMIAVALAVLTLAGPPWSWLEFHPSASLDWLASLSWTAATSAGVAFAVASARAARAACANPTERASSLPPNSACAR